MGNKNGGLVEFGGQNESGTERQRELERVRQRHREKLEEIERDIERQRREDEEVERQKEQERRKSERRHQNNLKKIEYFSQEEFLATDARIAETKQSIEERLETLKRLEKEMGIDEPQYK